MTSSNAEDTYPHWLDAVRNYREYINLKCIVYYPIWHLFYLTLTIVVVVFGGGFYLGHKLADVISLAGGPAKPVSTGIRRVADGLRSIGNRITSSTVVQEYGVYIFAAILLTVMLSWMGWIVWYLVNNPTIGYVAIGVMLGVIIFIGAIRLLKRHVVPYVKAGLADIAQRLGVTYQAFNEDAKRTPILRRIWGACPVSIKSPPKWFRELTDEL